MKIQHPHMKLYIYIYTHIQQYTFTYITIIFSQNMQGFQDIIKKTKNKPVIRNNKNETTSKQFQQARIIWTVNHFLQTQE